MPKKVIKKRRKDSKNDDIHEIIRALQILDIRFSDNASHLKRLEGILQYIVDRIVILESKLNIFQQYTVSGPPMKLSEKQTSPIEISKEGIYLKGVMISPNKKHE